jgi:hypothetical protein
MAPPIVLTTGTSGFLTQETSTFETIYPADSDASESAKLLRVARGYHSGAIDLSKVVNINIYGYIRSEAQMNSVTEKSERAAMQTRFNNLRNKLIQMGVPSDKIWIAGVAYSANWGGQINVSLKETNLNSIILPPYTPSVPSKNPQNPSGAKEQWIDADGSVKKDVLKDVIAVEIELSLKEGGIFRTKPPISVKASVKSDGTIEFGTELTAIEEEIKKKALWGAVEEVKFKISAEGNVGIKFDDKRINTELNAALKAALSATLVIPKTKMKIPVEVSIGVGINGEIVPGLQTTYRW